VHHERDEVHHQHHGDRQRVDQEADLQLEAARLHPCVDGAVEQVAGLHVLVDQHRQGEGNRDAEDGDHVRTGAAEDLAEEAGEDGADQGGQGNQ
jgi:hypothetical protein